MGGRCQGNRLTPYGHLRPLVYENTKERNINLLRERTGRTATCRPFTSSFQRNKKNTT